MIIMEFNAYYSEIFIKLCSLTKILMHKYSTLSHYCSVLFSFINCSALFPFLSISLPQLHPIRFFSFSVHKYSFLKLLLSLTVYLNFWWGCPWCGRLNMRIWFWFHWKFLKFSLIGMVVESKGVHLGARIEERNITLSWFFFNLEKFDNSRSFFILSNSREKFISMMKVLVLIVVGWVVSWKKLTYTKFFMVKVKLFIYLILVY